MRINAGDPFDQAAERGHREHAVENIRHQRPHAPKLLHIGQQAD